MAKKSIVSREQRKKLLSDSRREQRNALRLIVKKGSEDEADAAMLKLNTAKRNESPCRVRNRCRSCGRPRATLRRFGLCRICLRQAAMRGDVPGLKKSSW